MAVSIQYIGLYTRINIRVHYVPLHPVCVQKRYALTSVLKPGRPLNIRQAQEYVAIYRHRATVSPANVMYATSKTTPFQKRWSGHWVGPPPPHPLSQVTT